MVVESRDFESIPHDDPVVNPVRVAVPAIPLEAPKWEGELGVDWVRIEPKPGDSPTIFTNAFTFDDRLWTQAGTLFWTTTDGVHWERIIGLPTDREYFTKTYTSFNVAVHQGELWMLVVDTKGRGSLWKSANGETWTPVVEDQFWGGYGGVLCPVNGRLWYVGGRIDNNPGSVHEIVSSVWSSHDGRHWDLVSTEAPWHGRVNYECFGFDGKIWIVGGDGLSPKWKREIWVSEDGREWDEISADPTRFSPPFDHGNAHLFSTGGKLWAIDNLNYATHAIWNSADGVRWEKRTDNVALPQNKRYFGQELDGLWLVYRDPNPQTWRRTLGPDIYFSQNMLEWRKFEFTAEPQPSAFDVVAVHDDKLWAFAGLVVNGPAKNYVLSSTDGATWDLVTNAPQWGERGGMAVTSHAGKLWLVGGHDEGRSDGNPGRLYNDVWSSSNGADWNPVANAAQWSPRANAHLLSLDGSLVLIGGENYRAEDHLEWIGEAWGSKDGENWTKLNADLPFSLSTDVHPPVVYDDKIWVVGAYTNDNPSLIWNSLDGSQWQKVVTDQSWKPRTYVSVLPHQGKLWAFGGFNLTGDYDILISESVNEIEWTTDGKSWTTVLEYEDEARFTFEQMYSARGRMWSFGLFSGRIAYSGKP